MRKRPKDLAGSLASASPLLDARRSTACRRNKTSRTLKGLSRTSSAQFQTDNAIDLAPFAVQHDHGDVGKRASAFIARHTSRQTCPATSGPA